MGQISEVFPAKTIEEMKQFYEHTCEDTPQGAIFRARTNNAVITGYKSGKVLFQGTNPELEYKKWENQVIQFTEQSKSHSTQAVHHHTYSPPKHLFEQNHIGSDESGTGDYFGPITTCAVYVEDEQIGWLKEIGIQDSKALTDQRVKQLANDMIAARIPYSLMVLRNERYNQLQQQGWSQGKMKAMLHQAVIEKLVEKIEPKKAKGIIIDQFCQPNIYINHIGSEGKSLVENTYFMTKAENYSIAVAAGSIIARASFLEEMDRLSELVGVTLLKGASHKVDQIAAQIIRKNGEKMLFNIAKVHFENTKKAKRLN